MKIQYHPTTTLHLLARSFAFAVLCLSLLATAPAATPAAKPRPAVWFGPPGSDDGKSLRALFEHPDDWKETRSLVDVLLYSARNFTHQFSDDELRAWFAQLQEWKIKLALEVGAVKEWGQTADKTFKAQQPMWEHIERLGGHLYAISMDEPLCCAREKIHQSDEFAMQETANFIALVRQHFPEVLIGDIETYPAISVEDHIHWIEALQSRLAGMKVRGLDFYRLDVDWLRFTTQTNGSWQEVKKLETYCRGKKLPFSLIYWASGYPLMQKREMADDSTWYVSVMQQGYDYASIGGAPDQYVIESWVGAPSRAVPETGEFTFTRSVRDFARKFVKRGQ